MPFIAFESGQLDPKVRAELIEKLTEVSSQVTGIPKQFFLVSIREQPDDHIALGGVPVEELKRRRREQAAAGGGD